MKWCVCFPEEDILIKRPCLKRACIGNKIAATFLSFLLYQVSISREFRQSLENSSQQENVKENMPYQKMDINVYKTQLEIISEMDNEISDRTLRDTAIPLLIALGYIDVDESCKTNTYTIHLAQIQIGINNPPKTSEFLLKLQNLIEGENTSDKWRKYFLRLLEMLPTHSGKSTDPQKRSHVACQEGRRPSSSKDKSKKSNNDAKKIQAVARQTEETQQHAMTSIAATVQPSSEIFVRDVAPERQPEPEIPQSPDSAAPRTAKTVLQLIEFLRGHSFCEPEHSQQIRAAAILMSIQPELSLKDIQDAWTHGSDAYWKKHHDPSGMTVVDLAHHNSHGKRRIIAALEHKRHQEREPTRSGQASRLHTEHPLSTSVAKPHQSGQAMTEQEAQQLAIQATQDGQIHHYNLNAYCAYEHNIWVVKVHIEQHVLTIHGPSEWSQEFTGIHEVLQLRKKVSIIGKEDLLCSK